MAYEIPFTDEANKGSITVEDNAINTETSLLLPGRSLKDYGTSVLTNFLHLMENFADVNPPTNPVEGQLWYDTTAGIDQLKIYDGTNWVAAGGLKKAQTQPEATNSVVGDLWVNTATSQLYLYSGSGWLLIGPNFSEGNKTGALPEIIIDQSDVSRDVIVNYINNVPVSIVSTIEFKPKTVISGFDTIAAGLTLNSNYRINAIANKAAFLLENPGITTPTGTVPLSALARKDKIGEPQTFLSKVNLPNQGLDVGNVRTLSLSVEGQSGIVQLNQAGTIDFRTPVSTSPVMRIAQNGNVGFNNLSPDEVVDVKGNINIGVADGDDAALDTTGKLVVRSEFDSISPAGGALVVKGGVGIAKQLRVGSTTTLEAGLTVANVSGAILPPSGTNNSTIGTNSTRFSAVYANNLYGNTITGNLVGNVTGNITGSASKLNSSTSFTMTGDVTSSGFTFDGQTGGSTKTFTTTIAANFVDTKASVTTALPATVQSTDEFLLNRSGALYKATQAQVLASIPSFPVGTVLMWPGLLAPTGWFICDGEEYSATIYSALKDALGFDAADPTTYYFGTPSSGNFRIPDYRGRMPVGIDPRISASPFVAYDETNRITNASAGVMGGVGGNEDVALIQDNLPEHQHDLQSSTGEQFYAVTNATTSAPETLTGGGIDGGTGSRLGLSGGIYDGTANTPVNVTNPFAAINFIIYHGVI